MKLPCSTSLCGPHKNSCMPAVRDACIICTEIHCISTSNSPRSVLLACIFAYPRRSPDCTTKPLFCHSTSCINCGHGQMFNRAKPACPAFLSLTVLILAGPSSPAVLPNWQTGDPAQLSFTPPQQLPRTPEHATLPGRHRRGPLHTAQNTLCVPRPSCCSCSAAQHGITAQEASSAQQNKLVAWYCAGLRPVIVPKRSPPDLSNQCDAVL